MAKRGKKTTIDVWTCDDLSVDHAHLEFCSESQRVECGLADRDGQEWLCEGCRRVRLTIEETQ